MPSDLALGDERVLLVAPTRRDAEVTHSLLEKAHLQCVICDDLNELIEQLPRGVGAIMLTDRALFGSAIEALLDTLERQPPWSDVPLVVLTQQQTESSPASKLLSRFRNVTILDRPTSTRSMISAVQAALRGRRRQYELREQIHAQNAAEQALREADRRKDEFLATLAHELRNPLAPLRTGLELLDAASLNPDRAQHIRAMMGRQLGQLVKLIDDLLDVSRISTGKVILQLERVDLRNVVEAALESSQPAIQAAQHELRVHLPLTPVYVDCDPSRLEQVICNLINNACKYTPKHGHIEVALDEVDGHASLRVSDDGLGIPQEMLPLVFDMFTQVDRNLDRAQGGLGIGLSLVRRLMNLHGGTVHANSAGQHKGSTFTLMLPIGSRNPALPAEPQLSERLSQRPIRILIVDDNRDAADSLALLLAANGHQTKTVYGGEAAIRTAQTFQPEAIFCDLGMPTIDGFDVAEQLSGGAHAPPVLIALTGWGAEDDKRRTRESGFHFHVTKPIAMDELDRILSYVSRH